MVLRPFRLTTGGVALVAAALIVSACSSGSSTSSTTTSAGAPAGGATSTSGAPAGQKGGTIAVSINSAIDTWNPQAALATTSYQVYPQVYASLLRTTADGKTLLPALASSYKATAKTLTFTLDPAAKFSNGKPVTAADVKFSEALWRKGALYGSYFASIKAVRTPTAKTVIFDLANADKTLPAILSTTNAAIFPANYAGETSAVYWKKPIGAGPFMISKETVGQSITLVRNPYYYRSGLPYLDGINYKVVTDSNQQLLQFKSGALDIVNSVELDSAAQYSKDSLVSTPSSGVSILVLQTKTAPMNNKDFRNGLALAIDYKSLVAGGYVGEATTATSLLPQTVPGVSACSTCTWSKTDLTAAKKLVTSSGYSGQDLKLTVPSGAGPEKLAAQALIPMLAEAGIKATIEALPTSSVITNLSKGNFQLGALTYSALAPSPIDPLGFLGATSVAFSGANPAPANAALAAVHAASTAAAVTTAVQGFEKSANASDAVIPLAVPNAINAVASRVQGFVPAPYLVYCADQLSLKK